MVSEQLTRDRILEAASSLFAEKSFQEVGIREIAKRAGCSHTTIYLYFKNKDEILFEVASAPLEKLYQTSLEIYQSSESIENRLLEVCHHFIRFGFQYASSNQLLFIVEGEEVEIVGIKPTAKTTVTGVEMFRKLLDSGQAGDNIGALLRGTKKEEVERGQVLAKPGSVSPHTSFKSEVYVLTKDEGGRHTPFFTGYKPQFYFRTTDITGEVNLPDGVEMVMPGDNIEMSVELIHPIAMEEGLRFAIREGGRTVASGVVATIVK